MAQQGYAGTTLREIADKVGIRAPSLYHYFRNKDEIALALSNSGIEESLARGHVIATGPEAPSERLHRWIWEVVHSLCDFPYDLSWMLDASLQPPWPESDEGQTEFWQEDILGLVSAGIDEGEFLPADPRLGLIAIVGLIQATISRYHGQSPGTFSPAEMADYIAAFAVRALAVEPATFEPPAR